MDAKTQAEELVSQYDPGSANREMLEKAIAQALEAAHASGKKEGWQEAKDKMESIVAEFGDDPKACLGILGEHFCGGENVEY